MKNILIFAGIAGLAAAIAIYFVTEKDKNLYEDDDSYITDEDIADYDMRDNTGPAYNVDEGFKPAY